MINKIKINPVDDYTLERCRIFAEFSVGSSMGEYARRNQNNPEKVKMDIYRGKLAEFMIYKYMLSKGNTITVPDLEIYNYHNKNYSADFVCNGKNLHVKSHFVNEYYPVSWLFQKKDNLVSCETKDDFLFLVVMKNDGDAWFYVRQPQRELFRKPQKESLQSTKLCIYESDLLEDSKCL